MIVVTGTWPRLCGRRWLQAGNGRGVEQTGWQSRAALARRAREPNRVGAFILLAIRDSVVFFAVLVDVT